MTYPEKIDLASYIVERIKQSGVKKIMGVPGDYCLELCDYFENDPELEWVGNANELNAAYAADGYARVTHGLGVLVTTFGVGELSALNGIAGSMSERLPILHIVGTPSTGLQGQQALLHHTLGNGDFTAFSDMSAKIVTTVGLLKKGGRWTEEVDRVIAEALTQCRPVYLTLPSDLVHAQVSSEGLNTPLPTAHSAPPPSSTDLQSSDPDAAIQHVISEIVTRFKEAKKPIVIVDACTSRFGCGPELERLVEGTGMRFFETPMGKATLSESHPQYGGAYVGANSLPSIREEVESADFVLMSGRLESDFNSGSFTFDLAPKSTIELHSFATKIGFATYPSADIRTIIGPLTDALIASVKTTGIKEEVAPELVEKGKEERKEQAMVPLLEEGSGEGGEGGEIEHKWFWPRVGKFFKDYDLVVAETGTSAFGIVNVAFPAKASCIVQTLWGSIGWATGATLGVALAAQQLDHPSRTILFTGDGSLQLTVQEVGTMVRRGLCPYLFVLNNDGYEIERQIHGEKAKYNDIQMYDHQLLLPFFAGKKSKHPYQSYEVHTPAELDKLLLDPEFNIPDKIRLIEVYMPRGDAPASLISQSKLTAEANAKV